jgi:hypothetical protein
MALALEALNGRFTFAPEIDRVTDAAAFAPRLDA